MTLYSHIGLGDIILLAGAIVRLAQRYGRLRIYCYAKDYESVVSFFRNCVGIHIVPLESPPEQCYGVPEESALAPGDGGQVLRCGWYHSKGIDAGWNKSFPEVFYEQLGVDWTERWNASPINAAASWTQNENVCEVFVHDDADRDLVISRGIEGKTVYRPSGGGSILKHTTALRTAREIHVIDSAFYHLVESLEGISAKLFLHRYARSYIDGWNDYPRRHDWNILV
jgi:hypothetical protein